MIEKTIVEDPWEKRNNWHVLRRVASAIFGIVSSVVILLFMLVGSFPFGTILICCSAANDNRSLVYFFA